MQTYQILWSEGLYPKNNCIGEELEVAIAATMEVVVLPLYELIEAIKQNNVADAKLALDKHADPNGKEYGRLSMLQLAEKHHANSVVPLLVRSGADLFEQIGSKKDSLLHRAARNENVGFACALLNEGLSPNLRNARGEVPLHIAARTGQAYLAKYLINHNAEVMVKDSKGRTPLSVAVSAHQIELVRLLEPMEIYARQFGDHQDILNPDKPSKTPAEASSLELQTASESHPKANFNDRFTKRLKSVRESTLSKSRLDR